MDEVALRDGSRVLVRPIRPLQEKQLRYLTEVDHHDPEALLALDAESGHAVGVGRFVRTAPEVAEVAITVADDWQGRGMGTFLLEALAAAARDEGIAKFSALILETNDDVLNLLRRLGPVEVADRGERAVELVADLPPASRQGRELLRLAAREEAAVASRS